jgi:uncharacterized protein (DUF486 family)
MSGLPVVAQTTILPTGSNVFMTFERYAQLRNLNDTPLWIAIVRGSA